MSGLVFVLLGEDRATDGPEIQKKLLIAALQCLVDGLQTHKLVFVAPPPATARLAKARAWASRRACVDMVRAIASELRQGRVVVLHYDADGPWPGPTENDNQFRERIREPLRKALGSEPDCLVAMVPYICIESWTYRNAARAIELCTQRGLDSAKHKAWELQPALLESTMGIKEASPLRDGSNLALVQTGWPRREAHADERSFAQLVERLRAVPGLIEKLPRPLDP